MIRTLLLLNFVLPPFSNALDAVSDPPFWKNRSFSSVYDLRIAIPIGPVSAESRAQLSYVVDGWLLPHTRIESIPADEAEALSDVILASEEQKVGILFLGHCHAVSPVFVSDEAIRQERKAGRKLIWNALKALLADQAALDRCTVAATAADGTVNHFGFEKFSSETLQKLDGALERVRREGLFQDPTQSPIGTPEDLAAIRGISIKFVELWNAKNAQALSDLLSPSARFTNYVGMVWKSAAEATEAHAKAFETLFKDSTLSEVETEVRFLSSTVAVSHFRWKLVGGIDRVTKKESGPREGYLLFVLEKRASGWKVHTAQNTDIRAGG